MPKSDSPVLMPVLSAGKHRSPRQGACFMEFASWLAGESWSDHPVCTHPALAALARLVNDCSTNNGRARLVELIPSVIGLGSDEPLTSVLVAARAASTAIAVANEDTQRALAAGLFCIERSLSTDHSIVAEQIRELVRTGLDTAPAARVWAEDFSRTQPLPRSRDMVRVSAAALRVSVVGIAEACVDDPDGILHDLLRAAIADIIVRVPQQIAETPHEVMLLQHS